MDVALDNGITEKEFWEMTIAEITRAIKSRERVKMAELKEKAVLDYKLADLIARSMARLYSSSAEMPDISEIYPSLFDSVAIKMQRQEKANELSALRFKQFAQNFNKNLQQRGAKDNYEQ